MAYQKENIGLIEVMGLAVLPSRLNKELAKLEDELVNNIDPASDPLTENMQTGLSKSKKNIQI